MPIVAVTRRAHDEAYNALLVLQYWQGFRLQFRFYYVRGYNFGSWLENSICKNDLGLGFELLGLYQDGFES
jgi:hypothetical protein